MSHREAALVLGDLAPAAAAGLLHHLPSLSAALALEQLAAEKAAAILTAVRPDIAAAILRTTPNERRAAVVECFPERRQALIANLLIYAEDTAGALMDPSVPTACEQEPVRQVLERLQRNPAHALYYLYVIAEDQRLVGVVNMRELMGAPPDATRRVRLHAPRRIHCRQRHLANRGRAPSVEQRPRAARSGHNGPVRRCPPLRNRAGFGATAS